MIDVLANATGASGVLGWYAVRPYLRCARAGVGVQKQIGVSLRGDRIMKLGFSGDVVTAGFVFVGAVVGRERNGL